MLCRKFLEEQQHLQWAQDDKPWEKGEGQSWQREWQVPKQRHETLKTGAIHLAAEYRFERAQGVCSKGSYVGDQTSSPIFPTGDRLGESESLD